ncbi:DUF1116 domain-containing protein [Salsipaludibacter albus]|uniref:DUF1116 domain-containing protein n=1 Tax=Salsipaludibacter albus TaxID=2849650 RepID=UPI001EE3A368|nr:DUF1116 domain-containing protein [Salsipaludibacter albus]MBY5163015.1 DUF1116 domain-containing protein [Salsipaludibacter albus]
MSSRLLTETPDVVTVGVDLFERTLADQGVEVTAVDWRPPSVDGAVLGALDVHRLATANAEAFDRLVAAEPHWVGIASARDAVGIETGQFLHAGPPLTWERASGPMRGALVGAMLYEGMADTPDEAIAIGERGELELAPCHSAGAVGPMAGVVSPSMPMFRVHNDAFGNDAWCTLNEGLGKVLRYGAYADEVVERLTWMQQVLGPALADAVGVHGPLDLRSLVANALQMGDELHNRNRAATSLFVRELMPSLLATDRPTAQLAEVADFVNGNDHFFLNLVMPAAKAATDPCRDIDGSSMVVAMARNGTDFGIQVSGTGDAWFVGPAGVPDGLFLGDYTAEDANPDIGDSTITETSGLGGFAMAAAPAIVKFIGGEVADALEATQSMYGITIGEHPAYQVPILDFRGTPTGIDVVRIVRSGVVPFVNTGIAGREAGTGQVGAGLVTPPMEVFTAAVEALADRARAG